MSDNMNFGIFARTWLEHAGLFDKDSDYGGATGEAVMEVIECLRKQGHSGGSASVVFAALSAIYEAYETPDHPIWRDYWKSDEGQKLIAQFNGRETR